MLKRNKYMENVKVDGITFIIQMTETLKYDGKWDVTGFNVYWIDAGLFEGPHNFIGYPTDSDLRNLIK
jgi:hypothetical protein